MKVERDIPAIVTSIAVVLAKAAPSGMAIEPIATMQDPDDLVDGDYSIRCAVEIRAHPDLDQSKRYMSLFEASIHMENWLTMSNARFKLNLKRLGVAITEFKDMKMDENSEGIMTTRTGIFDLHELGKKARRGSIQ